MPFLPVILWTDALVYLLLAAVAGFTWYVRRHEHLLAPWRRVAQTPAAMSALVVLAAFMFTGLLDSVHFRLSLPAAPTTQAGKDTPRATAYATEGVSATAQANRAVLRNAMAAGGLAVYSGEWWHFDGPGAAQPRAILDVPVN